MFRTYPRSVDDSFKNYVKTRSNRYASAQLPVQLRVQLAQPLLRFVETARADLLLGNAQHAVEILRNLRQNLLPQTPRRAGLARLVQNHRVIEQQSHVQRVFQVLAQRLRVGSDQPAGIVAQLRLGERMPQDFVHRELRVLEVRAQATQHRHVVPHQRGERRPALDAQTHVLLVEEPRLVQIVGVQEVALQQLRFQQQRVQKDAL